MTRAPQWFTVAAGTPPSQCHSCHAVVYWIRTTAGKPMQVDVDVEGGHEPTEREDGQGVSHFATCPDADQWRKRDAQPARIGGDE